MFSIQPSVIKLVSDLGHVCGFVSPSTLVSTTNKAAKVITARPRDDRNAKYSVVII